MNRRAAISRLKHLLAEPGPRSFIWYHTIGGVVLSCLPADHRYGIYSALLDDLVDSFGSQAPSRESEITTLRGILDTSQAFHEAYTVSEVRELESPPAGTHRLTWNQSANPGPAAGRGTEADAARRDQGEVVVGAIDAGDPTQAGKEEPRWQTDAEIAHHTSGIADTGSGVGALARARGSRPGEPCFADPRK
jgi:hypothetical protein